MRRRLRELSRRDLALEKVVLQDLLADENANGRQTYYLAVCATLHLRKPEKGPDKGGKSYSAPNVASFARKTPGSGVDDGWVQPGAAEIKQVQKDSSNGNCLVAVS